MKKIISVFIVLTMLVSMIPSVFAEGEKVYTFKPDGNGHVILVSASATGDYTVEREMDGTTYYLSSTYFSNYGSRGWKILDADESMIINAPASGNIFRLFYDSVTSYLQSNNVSERIFRIAVSTEAPETEGFYVPVVSGASSAKVTSAFFDVYAGLYETGKNSLDDYSNAKYMIETTWETPTWGDVVHTGKTAIYTKSDDEVVFVINARDNAKTQKLYNITLNPILDPVVKTVIKNTDDTTSSEISFNLGDAANNVQKVTLSTTVSGTDVTDMPVSDDFITYKSSDEAVATVASDGTITAVGAGSATIYAESSDKKYNSLDNGITVTVTVPQPVAKTYTFNFDAVNLGAGTLLSDITETKTDKNGNNIYDTYGWRYFPTEGDATAKESLSSPFYAVVSNLANSLIFHEKYGEFKFALMVKAPEIAAFYKPSATVYGYEGTSNARSIKMYMSKPSEDTAFDYYAESNLVYSGQSGSYADAILAADKALYAGSDESIVSAFWSSNSRQRFRSFTLDPILNPVMKTVVRDSEDVASSLSLELRSDEQTVALETTVSGTDVTDMPVSNNFITYKSSNENVVTVSADGKATVVGEGTAKIYAETSDKKYSSIENGVSITVTAPSVPEEDAELTEAFAVTKAPATGYVESTVTGITESSTIKAEKNSDGTFSLTAPETKGDARFLYWAKGMSRSKKIVSFSNELSNYMPEENGKNYIIAVYECDVSDTAEYYNANGQRIATGTAPGYPSMAGYGKATGWTQYGETNIYVAEYGNKTQPDNVTVTVDGKAQTVPYGTKITCTADNSKENFKCWIKSDINGKPEIASAEKSYSFNAWETCTVTAIYGEHIYTGAKMKILIDTLSVGSETAVMAEFIGFDKAVEKGIMYNGTKIAMTKPGNQFTIMADEGGTFVGYAIIGNATDGYTLVTDGSVTVNE